MMVKMRGNGGKGHKELTPGREDLPRDHAYNGMYHFFEIFASN